MHAFIVKLVCTHIHSENFSNYCKKIILIYYYLSNIAYGITIYLKIKLLFNSKNKFLYLKSSQYCRIFQMILLETITEEFII